jgi:cold shock protein
LSVGEVSTTRLVFAPEILSEIAAIKKHLLTATPANAADTTCTPVGTSGRVASLRIVAIAWGSTRDRHGKVLSRRQGLGNPDDSSADVFVHYSAIKMRGRKTLTDGQRVDFDFESTPRGRRATSVWRAVEDGKARQNPV